MSSSARSGWFGLACALAALVPLGCTPNLEKNEQFAAEKAHLERVDADLKKARIDVVNLTNEVGRLTTDIAALKKGVPAGAGVPADVLGGMTQRLNSLDVQVRTLTAALKAQPAAAPKAAASEEAATPAPAGRARLTPARPAPTPKGQMAITVKGGRKGAAPASHAASATKKSGKAAASRASDSATAASSAPAGFYHQVSASDTLASIAAKYGVPAAAIIKANGLSASNPRIFSGSALYIPRKSAK